MVTEIKICGITREEEVGFLNETQVDYAGFVFYEKSKRHVSVDYAQKFVGKLNPDIKKVAVTVSPDLTLVRQIEQAGFDILQIHGTFDREILKAVRISVWMAVNLSGTDEVKRWCSQPMEGIDAILFDAGDFGSGKTFGWEQRDGADGEQRMEWKENFARFRAKLKEQKIRFVLAGGLHPSNVAEGITLFSPDVVDVSSGVEEILDGMRGKSREKIEAFAAAVRSADEKTAQPLI